MKPKRIYKRIIGRTGDVNPVDYGGGVVFKFNDGRTVLEHTPGLHTFEPGPERLEVYQAYIEPEMPEWVDWPAVCQSHGHTPEIPEASDMFGWAMIYEMIADYYGWGEFDWYPQVYTASQITKRWKL